MVGDVFRTRNEFNHSVMMDARAKFIFVFLGQYRPNRSEMDRQFGGLSALPFKDPTDVDHEGTGVLSRLTDENWTFEEREWSNQPELHYKRDENGISLYRREYQTSFKMSYIIQSGSLFPSHSHR